MAVVNQPVQWELEDSRKYEEINLQEDIPPGLKKLRDLKQMVLIQQVEDKEAWWSRNMYKIEDGRGQVVFSCIEDKSYHPIVRASLTKGRPFIVTVVDQQTRECILEFERPMACSCPMMCPFQRHSITVRLPNGEVIGQVQHSSRESCRSWCDPSIYYNIHNHEGKTVYKVEGDSCYPCEVFDATTFNVVSVDSSTRIGQITHQWMGSFGCCSCCVTGEVDQAVISFPVEMNVKSKALMLATLLLTHFNYFDVL